MWYLMRCYCFTIPTDLEFKQRQPEVERSQVTMSLKLGQGAYGEVSNWCKLLVFSYIESYPSLIPSSSPPSPSPPSPPFFLFLSNPFDLLPLLTLFFFYPTLPSPPLQSWKGSWSGHTVVMKKLKTKGDVFKSGYMDSFPHEYLRLR